MKVARGNIHNSQGKSPAPTSKWQSCEVQMTVSQASSAKNCICCRFLNELEGKEELVTHALPYLIIRSLNRGIVSQLTETLVLLEGFSYDLETE